MEVVDAPRRLVFTWETDRLTFELTPDGDGTTFTLIHSFDDRHGAASFATGWELCLAGLRSVLAGDPLPPPERGVARHEELVHEFGLDRPEVTESDGRWTVRVERQLTCPAEFAWDLWFGKDRDTGEQRPAPGVGAAADAVHGAGCRDRNDDRGRPASCVRVRRGTERRAGRAPSARVRRWHRPRRRVILTVTGTDPGERDAAAQMWGTGAIGHLAASAAEWAAAQPVEA